MQEMMMDILTESSEVVVRGTPSLPSVFYRPVPYQTPPRFIYRRPSVVRPVVSPSVTSEISAKFFSVCSRFIFCLFEFYNYFIFFYGIKSGRYVWKSVLELN
jgi:hypothetical protein